MSRRLLGEWNRQDIVLMVFFLNCWGMLQYLTFHKSELSASVKINSLSMAQALISNVCQ